jgi:cell division septal protein FtsQ
VSLPLTIQISITERVPVAVASDGRESVLVASDGTMLGPAPRSVAARGLPLIELPADGSLDGATRTPVGAALALGAMDEDLRSAVERVSVLTDGTLEIWLRSGPRVSFGRATAVGSKARAIARALAWANIEGERILSLSVVAPSTPSAILTP